MLSGKAIGPEKPKEGNDAPPFPETLLQLLCRMLPDSEDLAVQCQLAESLRMLLDIPQGEPGGEAHVRIIIPGNFKHELTKSTDGRGFQTVSTADQRRSKR